MEFCHFSLCLVSVFFFSVTFIRQVNQYERGVMLTLGKFSGIKEPGWRIVVPIFQQMRKIDIRTKAVDVPDQKPLRKTMFRHKLMWWCITE